MGYKEQLYVNWVPNHPPTVPDGQVMLDNGIHDAQVSIIGSPHRIRKQLNELS